MLKETSSKKKHFQNDSRIIFSSIFNFVVISRLKCNLKINFSYWKFRHFKKDSAYLSSFDFFNFSNHNCQRIFWTWWILSSDVWIKLILVSKLFLSLVNTRNNKKIHQIQGFQHMSVCFCFFFAFFCNYSNHSHKCDDIEIQLCEKYSKFQTSFTKGKHLEQNNFLQSSNSLPWVWNFFHPPL